MNTSAPGSYRPLDDRWSSFESCARSLEAGALVVADRRVLKLHPKVRRALAPRKPLAIVEVSAGEQAKSLAELERVLSSAVPLSRKGTLVCIGGGTLGDLCTVAAHLIKRGVRLIQVPTTVLAAVDSSVGGKGAVHLSAGRHIVKNAAGAFHYADRAWLCPELFESLSPKQLREGRVEAFKMAVTLDPSLWKRARSMPLEALIRRSRKLKDEVCRQDPYEVSGLRAVLNFGHTFGHVVESVSNFRISHGDSVALGVLCALDVGRALRRTPPALATQTEATFASLHGPGRAELARVFRTASLSEVAKILAADKKVGADGQLRMVLLERVGKATVHEVAARTWRPLWRAWSQGARP